MGIDQHVAQGANLVFFVPTSVVSIITNIKHKLIRWKTGITVSICGVIGAMIRSKNICELGYKQTKVVFWYFFANYSRNRDFYISKKERINLV